MIGKGAYGEVHQGLLAKDGVYIGVAIKQLTAHGSIDQLLHEAVCKYLNCDDFCACMSAKTGLKPHARNAKTIRWTCADGQKLPSFAYETVVSAYGSL
jgi:hypothetical protein